MNWEELRGGRARQGALRQLSWRGGGREEEGSGESHSQEYPGSLRSGTLPLIVFTNLCHVTLTLGGRQAGSERETGTLSFPCIVSVAALPSWPRRSVLVALG